MLSGGLIWVFFIIWSFVMGVLVAALFQRHHRGAKTSVPAPPPAPVPPVYNLPADFKERLLAAAQEQFQTAVNASAGHLQKDLDYTGDQVNKLVLRLATEIVSRELERYHMGLTRLHDQATAEMKAISQEISQHKEELKAQLDQEIKAEKQRLIKQIDGKLADAVASFLLETLGHNADLGSQAPYLITTLEEHKADFKREVADDAAAAK